MELGKTLRMLRIKSGFSQEKLAEKLFIARSTISKIENDVMEIAGKDLIKWCKVTHHQEVLIALLCGADLSMVQQVMDVISNTTIVGTIIRWGGVFQWINLF